MEIVQGHEKSLVRIHIDASVKFEVQLRILFLVTPLLECERRTSWQCLQDPSATNQYKLKQTEELLWAGLDETLSRKIN